MNILVRYKDVLIETLKENKKMIAIFTAMYFIIAIATYFFANSVITSNYAQFHSTRRPNLNVIGEGKTALDLFLNNSRSVVLSYIGGIFFGLLSIFSLIVNAFALGSQTASFGFIQAGGSLRFIAYLIPHGIFEITGTILETVAGVILFKFIWRFLKGLSNSEEAGFKEKLSESYQNNRQILIQSFALMIFCIILMAIAAPIEYYISKAFCNLILGPDPGFLI